MRSVAAISGICALLAGVAHAGSISGTVYLKREGARKPFARVQVVAKTADGAQTSQSTFTDAARRYTLTNIGGERLSITASLAGYFPRSSRGGKRALVIDLGRNEQLDGLDFDLAPGGVITGRVTDSQGTPVDSALVLVCRVVHSRAPGAENSVFAKTDDRGIYRAFGLDRGVYLVFAKPTQWDGGERPAGVFYGDAADQGHAREIELPDGGEITGIDVALRPAAAFRLAGKITGVDAESMPRTRVNAASMASYPYSPVSNSAPVSADGSFEFPSLPAGTYLVAAAAESPQLRPVKTTTLKVDLSADARDILLYPMRPARLAGIVTITGAGRKPGVVSLRAVETATGQPLDLTAKAPDYRFDSGDIPPGAYTLDLASPSVYWKAIVQESRSAGREIAVAPGAAATVRVEVGIDFGQVAGAVKDAGGRAVSQAQVALAEARGSTVDFRSVQADQNGRFSFSDVPPGNYFLAAWPDIAPAALYEPDTWRKAGQAVKPVVVEPSGRIEVELASAGAGQ